MRRLWMTSVAMLLLAGTAQAETIKANVNGLVCSFCATGIEKSFKAQPEVDSVQVDLDRQLVTITTKLESSLDDAAVTKVLTDAGYTVTDIARAE